MAENYTYTALAMDRSEPVGNSEDSEGRRSLHVLNMASLLGSTRYDSGTVSYPNNTTEIYQFRLGGITGPIQATVTLVYADASKNNLVSWSKA